MKITELTCWEINKRIALLQDFQKQISLYFDNIDDHWELDEPTENDKAMRARTNLNKLSQQAMRFVFDAGVPSDVVCFPAPNVGGYARQMDVLANLFNLKQANVPYSKAIDIVEQALGVYEADFPMAKLRTMNPIFWIKKLLRSIGSIPFAILEYAGFRGKKYADSTTGKIISLITQLLALMTALCAFLKGIGREDLIAHLFK